VRLRPEKAASVMDIAEIRHCLRSDISQCINSLNQDLFGDLQGKKRKQIAAMAEIGKTLESYRTMIEALRTGHTEGNDAIERDPSREQGD
jgi:hypothetical protein